MGKKKKNYCGGKQYKLYTYSSKKYPDSTTSKDVYGKDGERKCASYSGEKSYRCSGNRDVNMDRDLSYTNFLSGDTIDHVNITPFVDRINSEITQRKKNGLYVNFSSQNAPTVNSGDTILSSQPNSIADLVTKLDSYILRIGDYKFSTEKIEEITDIEGFPVPSGKICQPEDVKNLERYLNSQFNDCICYSDCTSYGYTLKCNCHGYCGCNYYK